MMLRIPTLLLFFALWLAAPARAEQAESGSAGVVLSYEVYLGGAHILSAEMRLSLVGGHYRSDVSTWAEGLFDVFVDFRLDSSVEGRVDDVGLRPRLFRSHSRWNDKAPKRIRMRYRKGAAPLVSLEPVSLMTDKDPLPESLRHDTLDPLSALMFLGHTSLRHSGCRGSLPIFDGRRGFDAILRDLGAARVSASRYQIYDGPALRCQVRLKRIYDPKEPESDAPNSSYPGRAEIFLAALAENLPPVPVRLELHHKYGALRAHLVGFERL